MELLQDPAFKLKYQRSKYKVKIWESEFLKTNGCNPSRNDIKSAPVKVREAYKMYYKLKSMVLQDTLMDITFSDEPENSPSDVKLLDPKLDAQDIVQTEEVKTPRMVLGDIKVDETISENQAATEEDSSKTKMPDDIRKGVWGDHLNKTAIPKAITTSEKKRQLTKSQSFNLSKKLFAGSTFNKRNPRKSFSFSRPQKDKSGDGSGVESLSTCSQPLESSVDMSVSLPLFQNQSQTSELLHSQSTKMLPNFLNTSENFKVVVNSTPKVNAQAISAIHRVLSTSHLEAKLTPRNIDRGWLDRCTKYNSLDQSGVSLNSSALSKSFSGIERNSSFSGSRKPEGEESDEDLVYSSEDEQVSSMPFPCLESVKRKKSFEEPEEIETDETQTELQPREKSPVFELQNPVKRVKYTEKPEAESASPLPDSKIDGDKIKNIDIEKIADDIVKKEEKLKKKPVKRQTKTTKMDLLEKKMASGEANENFVKVNMKKKVYVRGKKSMNLTKYKKTEWKKKKKAAGAGSTYDGPSKEMSKCFKCGDIGHWAGDCQNKGDNLLPVDDNEVEASQFPTLEEVQAMCLRTEHSLHQKSVTHFESQDSPTVDETNPAQVEGENFSNKLLIVNNIKPLYELNADGTMIDTPPEVYEALEVMGHESFRPGQEEAVMRILSGLSTLVTLATGTGKSLCYQLPAYLMAQRGPCITLVVSPLVSLMEDQVLGTCKHLKAACLHNNQKPPQRLKVMEQAKAGEIDVLLVSPEAVVADGKFTGFGSILRELPAIAFACIDEVHCVSQWSHNFRPSYLMICRVLREKLGVRTLLGLTATATKATCDSIVRHLEVPDGDRGVIRDVPLPNNLVLSVSKDPSPDRALIALLRGERFRGADSVIVYCTRQAECERLAVLIRTSFRDEKPSGRIKLRKTMSWFSEAYHAGLCASRRKQIQKAFMTGQLRIIVATVAFGMGINKQDIRAVVHFNMPKTFESYVQEIGRAGRDGLPAHCHLFLDSQGGDQNELRRHIFSDSVDRHTIRKLLERVFVPCKCVQISDMIDGIAFNDDFDDETPMESQKDASNNTKTVKVSNIKCPGHEIAFSIDDTVQALDLAQENISTLLCYLELHKKKWIKVLSPVYTTCKVMSYKGLKGLKAAAQISPPLAMAIALDRRRGVTHENTTVLEFPVVDVAAAIGWDSGSAKHHLRNLMWKKAEDGRWARTGLSVEFKVLGFRVRAPGNLNGAQLDEALDSLFERVNRQENMAVLQLQTVFKALASVAHPNCIECRDTADEARSEKLKLMIREYFNQDEITEKIDVVTKLPNEEEVAGDIRSLICSFRDQTFTGRAIARILYGISSPCYPAITWGRNRFWRSHLKSDFKQLCAIATREILRIK